jgi:hypothetical protein
MLACNIDAKRLSALVDSFYAASAEPERWPHEGQKILKPLWSRITPAFQLPAVFKSAVRRRTKRQRFRFAAPQQSLVQKADVVYLTTDVMISIG